MCKQKARQFKKRIAANSFSASENCAATAFQRWTGDIDTYYFLARHTLSIPLSWLSREASSLAR